MAKKTTTKTTPWLHWNTEFKDGWDDDHDDLWFGTAPKSFSNPLFDIPKDASEIRFVASKLLDEGFSYKILAVHDYSVELGLSNGKRYTYDNILYATFRDFLYDNSGLYLSLE